MLNRKQCMSCWVCSSIWFFDVNANFSVWIHSSCQGWLNYGEKVYQPWKPHITAVSFSDLIFAEHIFGWFLMKTLYTHKTMMRHENLLMNFHFLSSSLQNPPSINGIRILLISSFSFLFASILKGICNTRIAIFFHRLCLHTFINWNFPSF